MNQSVLLLIAIFLSSCGSPTSFRSTPFSIPTESEKLNEKALETLFVNEPIRKNSLRFAFTADPQGGPVNFLKLLKQLDTTKDLDFILVLGDFTDFGLEQEYEWAIAAIKESKKTPVIVVPGNHDGLGRGKEIFLRAFGSLDNTFTYKGVNFILWNNNPLEFGGGFSVDYVENALMGSFSRNEKTVIASHMSPASFRSSQKDIFSADRWEELLKSYESSILGSLHGHVHYSAITETKPQIATIGTASSFTWGLAEMVDGYLSLSHCVALATCSDFEKEKKK